MKYGMKRFFVILTLLTAAGLCFSEETAKSLALQASKKDDVELSISYLEKNIPSLKTPAEKRAAYVYLASILEKMGRYTQAQKNYAQAAAIAAGNAEGMPKKTTEEIVLDAVRCALCAGDSETAKSYLNSAVRNSSSEKVQAYIKLYEQWALLIDSDSVKKTGEIVAILKTYAELDSMKSVRPKILLTLWHVTGDKSWSQKLQKNFKGTPEEAVVSGKIQMQPSPFWYFVPRSGNAVPDVVNQDAKNVETARVPEGTERHPVRRGTAVPGSGRPPDDLRVRNALPGGPSERRQVFQNPPARPVPGPGSGAVRAARGYGKASEGNDGSADRISVPATCRARVCTPQSS